MTRFLVVDDEERICRFVARSLEAHGYRVDSAATAAEALRRASETEYALIILDLLLPDGDGYDVLRRIIDNDPLQRVLILSAVGDADSRVRCLRLGAVDFLGKPFAIAELVERVKHRLDVGAHSSTRYLEVGGLRLDLQARVLHAVDGTIVLTPREFVLLEHLMRRSNEVCTRLELLDEVWGYSFDPGSNVVDVCVRRLRHKLENNDLIETVRNVGYCFVAV